MAESGASKRGGRRGGKGKYYVGKKGRAPGPPRGGDGTGDFKGGTMSAYRTQPLPEILTAPGIAVTTVQGKEGIAEREVIEALEQAADELYPETGSGAGNGDGDDDGEGDIEDMLKKELESMASAPTKKSSRFRVCKREAPCVCYIIVLEPLDPLALVRHILEKCERTARCSFRFVQRLTPISAAGTGNLTSLAELAARILPAGFATDDERALKFGIITNSRNSDKLQRLDMIRTVAEEVGKLGPDHKVDLKEPDRTILVELYRNLMGLSVVENFDRYKKFNPARVAKDAASGSKSPEKQQPPEDQGEKRTRTQANNDYRERRRAELADKAANEAGAQDGADGGASRKRKADDGLEEGQIPLQAEDVERGEVVEDETADLGDDFVERIQDGRATKVRREE